MKEKIVSKFNEVNSHVNFRNCKSLTLANCHSHQAKTSRTLSKVSSRPIKQENDCFLSECNQGPLECAVFLYFWSGSEMLFQSTTSVQEVLVQRKFSEGIQY